MEQLQHATIESFRSLEEAIDRYNMLISSYNLDQRIITNLTDANKQWSKYYESLETKATKRIVNLQDEIIELRKIIIQQDLKIENLEDEISGKENELEEIKEEIEMYRDNPEGSEENNYDRD